MYTRPAAAWLAPPHETALARLGAPPPRRPPPLAAARRLSAFGQGAAPPTVDPADTERIAAALRAAGYFAEPSAWETFGEAAGTIIRATTPLALPLLQQEIFGEVPRPALPTGYAYSPTGQVLPPPRPTGGWTMPLLLLGGAAVVGGALYMTGRRRA